MKNLTAERAISKITNLSYKCGVIFENTMIVRIHAGSTVDGCIVQEIIKEMENDNYNLLSIDVNTDDRLNPKLDIVFGKNI